MSSRSYPSRFEPWRRTASATLFIVAMSTAFPAFSQTFTSKAGVKFRAVEVVGGLSSPWSLAFLPGGDMLVTEKPGRLRLIRAGKLEREPIAGVPQVAARGQGGLLDVVLHPDFGRNQLIYLSYSGDGEGGANTEVMRAKLNGSSLDEAKVIFRATPKTGGGNHYGSRMAFAPDGALFITLGDRFTYRDEAQNPGNHLGTIVRLRDDGTVPDDNPLKTRANARPEVFSYGHRNVQGLALRPGTSE